MGARAAAAEVDGYMDQTFSDLPVDQCRVILIFPTELFSSVPAGTILYCTTVYIQ